MASQGNAVDAQTAVEAAKTEVENNTLLKRDQLSAIERMAHGDKARESRLYAAACFIMKCYAQFAADTPEYKKYADLEREGSKYADEINDLKKYSYTERVASESGYPANGNLVTYKDLFNYTPDDAARDGRAIAETYRVKQLQQIGLSESQAKTLLVGVDVALLMSGTIKGFKLGEIPAATLTQEERVAVVVTNRGTSNVTKSGTLQNLRPGDAVFSQRPVRTLVQDESGRYWLQRPSGNRITPSGSYDFVTMQDGTIRVARPNPNPEFSTHLGLSGGADVSYAGSIRFGNNTGPSRGTIVTWTNNSGHYQPPASLNKNAGLPVSLFDAH